MTIKILEKLTEASLRAVDLCDFFSSGGFTYKTKKTKQAYREFNERSKGRAQEGRRAVASITEWIELQGVISRLTKQGLIARQEKRRRSAISITAKGAKQYEIWKKWLMINRTQPPPTIDAPTKYEKRPSRRPIIVSFDIPEKEANKRAWLRSALKNLDFKILHHSTWIGENALPKEFIKELYRLRMQRYVQIFFVLRHGKTAAK